VGGAFEKLLRLSPDTEARNWTVRGNETPDIVSEIWSEECRASRDEVFRHGRRMCAKVHFLKTLCRKTGKNLVFTVAMQRDLERRYRAGVDETGYIQYSHKVFVFSESGVLHDSAKNYRVG
jgi:hypothetical protein